MSSGHLTLFHLNKALVQLGPGLALLPWDESDQSLLAMVPRAVSFSPLSPVLPGPAV